MALCGLILGLTHSTSLVRCIDTGTHADICGFFMSAVAQCNSVRLIQSELPRPNPQNSVESDHDVHRGSTFNVMLTLYNVTLTSQKPCLQNNKCDRSKTNGLNEVYVFSIKYRYSDILLKKI